MRLINKSKKNIFRLFDFIRDVIWHYATNYHFLSTDIDLFSKKIILFFFENKKRK